MKYEIILFNAKAMNKNYGNQRTEFLDCENVKLILKS